MNELIKQAAIVKKKVIGMVFKDRGLAAISQRALGGKITGKTLTMAIGITLALPVLTSCSTTEQRQLLQAISAENPEKSLQQIRDEKLKQYQQDPTALVGDLKNLSKAFKDLRNAVQQIWGEQDAEMPSKQKYVKYTDGYHSKATVDFQRGEVVVETLNPKAPESQLREAIVTTLLTTDDPAATDIFSDKTPAFNGQPYLYEQVVDQDGKAIRYAWRANRFAKHLIATQMKVKQDKVGKHYSVTFPLVNNHSHLRKQQYSEYVLQASARYQVAPALIYAIIETESSFNPFAVSPANAYGLMQVVPKTAGKDVYTRVKKRDDQPTQSVLFTPKDNIDIGTAYLHILDDIYLKKLNDRLSREYAVISAYNGGAGNVFKTFSSNRSVAPDVINRLSPEQVYQRLTHEHPRAESRRYVQKVVKFKKKYQ